MIQNAYLYVSRGLLLIVLVIFSFQVEAQKTRPMKSGYQNFLDTQWWIGIRFGMNYSHANVVNPRSAFEAIDFESTALEKTYVKFEHPGVQAGLDLSFYYKGFSFVLQPAYKQVNFAYSSSRTWLDQEGADALTSVYEIDQSLSYIEVPLSLQYEFYHRGKIRPFILGGLQYSFMVGAQKSTKVTHTDFSGGVANDYSGGEFAIKVKDEFTNYYGALGGAGVNLDFWNIRTVFQACYYYGLSSVTNMNEPIRDNELSSLGEMTDELKLNHISFSMSFVFPLRYIDSTYQPY